MADFGHQGIGRAARQRGSGGVSQPRSTPPEAVEIFYTKAGVTFAEFLTLCLIWIFLLEDYFKVL